jgi:hypothetical protein
VKDLRDHLRESDPVAQEPGLSDDERRTMRRAVVAAVESDRVRMPWWRPMLMVATVTAVILAAVALRNRGPARDREPNQPSADRPASVQTAVLGGERRQIQFATPGGTRIIWVFDPEFHP